jgi:hypothetical protein
MAESSPLLDDFNGNLDDNFEAQTNVPVGNHFKRLRVIQNLIIITLILSATTVSLLIANYLVIKLGSPTFVGIYGPDTYRAQYSTIQLAKFVCILICLSQSTYKV